MTGAPNLIPHFQGRTRPPAPSSWHGLALRLSQILLHARLPGRGQGPSQNHGHYAPARRRSIPKYFLTPSTTARHASICLRVELPRLKTTDSRQFLVCCPFSARGLKPPSGLSHPVGGLLASFELCQPPSGQHS